MRMWNGHITVIPYLKLNTAYLHLNIK